MSEDCLNDAVLAERLREEDPEQFYTLVRMHLSFVLDLSTEDYDEPVEKSKFHPLNWKNLIFSKKTKFGSKNGVQGIPLAQAGICQVYQLLKFLGKEENIIQEGIFRRSGAITRQQELKSLLTHGLPLNLEGGYFSVHDCATVLKNFLADLPESLLTEAHYPAYCQIAEFCGDADSTNDSRLLPSLQFLMLLLPLENRFLLKELLDLLNLAAAREAQNKMSADNLATLFTPHLLCPRRLSPEAIHTNSQTMACVIAYMIRESGNLFNIPQKLAVDIRAYWKEQDKKRDDSPTMNGSTTVNTVYTFVDRNLSSQGNEDPTATALAQLYSHIQSMPESTKKRRLLKQFNKNTSLAYQNRNRSLSDSIKKHIPAFCNSSKHKQKYLMKDGCSTIHSLSQDIFSETMMTPRSRNPVMLLSGSNIGQLSHLTESQDSEMQNEDVFSFPEIPLKYFENLKMDHDHSSCNCSGPNCTGEYMSSECSECFGASSNHESCTFSSSVLTATPVDLSFSSRTGDFESYEMDEENKENNADKENIKNSSKEDKKLDFYLTDVSSHTNTRNMIQENFVKSIPIHETSL